MDAQVDAVRRMLADDAFCYVVAGLLPLAVRLQKQNFIIFNDLASQSWRWKHLQYECPRHFRFETAGQSPRTCGRCVL
jgi:hypothetical protein